MRKTFSFGKHAVNSERKINEITLEIELRENKENKPVFTASADVWNARHTDIVMGGQCLDDLMEYIGDNELFREIHGLWKRNHLNGLNAGTKEQMECIATHKDEINEEDGWYTKELNLLKKYNMDVVEYNGKPYKYGTGWIYRPIPDEDLKRIKELLSL